MDVIDSIGLGHIQFSQECKEDLQKMTAKDRAKLSSDLRGLVEMQELDQELEHVKKMDEISNTSLLSRNNDNVPSID